MTLPKKKRGQPSISNKLDLLELFRSGQSGGLAFGKSTWEDLRDFDPGLELIEAEYKTAKIPGMAECDGYKVYFTHEATPVLECMRILFSYPAGVWGLSRPTDAKLSVPHLGKHKPAFGRYQWKEIQTLPAAFRVLSSENYFCRSGSENQVFLVWVMDKCRLTLEYALEAHVLDVNQFEFDYYLQSAGIEDMSRSKLSAAKIKKYFFGT